MGYRVIKKGGKGGQPFIDDLLLKLDNPLLLTWGSEDPWIKPAAAEKIEQLHVEMHGENAGSENKFRWVKRVNIDAGHCPHDEAPEAVNKAIMEFCDEVLSA